MGSPYIGIHEFVDAVSDYEISAVNPPSSRLRSGYGFVRKGNLIFQDRGNYEEFELRSDGRYTRLAQYSGDTYRYRSALHEFGFEDGTGTATACLITSGQQCKKIKVKLGTFPYAYANANNAVIMITNAGEALMFKDQEWCRMTKVGDLYTCMKPEPELLGDPRGIQFYSSITYRGMTLLGEWPTGRLYEFDGTMLKPSEMTPPAIAEKAHLRLGYEAQSMAEYCGDLFVGYWPKGEVWRWDHRDEEWHYFRRFFTPVEDEPFIPHSNRAEDGLEAAFFGQRISALVPYGTALYVTTSNLSGWNSGKTAEHVLDADRIREYGATYKIERYGCKSSYMRLDNTQPMTSFFRNGAVH